MIYLTAFLSLPIAFIDSTEEGLDLGISLGKSGKIPEPRYEAGSPLHLLQIKGIREEISPVCQERIFFAIDIVAIFPADRIKTAVSIRSNPLDILQSNIAPKDGG